ncbi:MAG: EthD domain-containing protein [Candidatus Rokuibacteriota bacterium]
MVKLVYCITRRPGMSDAEFFHYWRHVHGPIGARIPGLRRLVQSHTLARTDEIRRPEFDGMAELWFDDFEAVLAARRSVEWRLSTDDERHFVDPTRVAFFVTEEHEIPLP